MRKYSIILLCCLAIGTPVCAWAETIAVIVPKGQTVKVAGAVDLALIYWRKKQYWEEGLRMQPVNLGTSNPLRQQFSLRILGSLPEAQTQYWNEAYFNGIMPPHVVTSQEAMLRYVEDTPGAIGYIDACKLDGRVKAVLWITAEGTVTATQPPSVCSSAP